jgi:hypothetical protein
MKPQQALIIQTLLEALLPVAGYLFWNWDTSFILQFFLLDWLLFYGLTVAKASKRASYFQSTAEQKIMRNNVILGALLLLATVLMVWILLPRLQQPFSWTERIWAFLSYQDLGIAQGLLLIPLILLNGILVYKTQFIRLRLFERLDMQQITGGLTKQGLILLGAAGVFFGFSFFTIYPPETVLFATIGGTLIYRFLARAY